MKNQQLLTSLVLSFWFMWFSIAGIITTALINWIVSANMERDDVLILGATIGIITGGITALTFFVIGKTRKLNGW